MDETSAMDGSAYRRAPRWMRQWWQTTDSISCRWMGRRTGGLRGG